MFNARNISYFLFLTSYLLASCSVQKQIDRSAKADVLSTKALEAAHVGISIYDPATGKYLYNYQGDHYFVPASNTKIPTCYAAMKYLGDSLVGLRWQKESNYVKIFPTGDPTFLHDDFKRQPVFDFLKKQTTNIFLSNPTWKDEIYGSGWAWNDYDAYYMAEKAAMPAFGNVFKVYFQKDSLVVIPDMKGDVNRVIIWQQTQDSTRVVNGEKRTKKNLPEKFKITRNRNYNILEIEKSNSEFKSQEIPIYNTEFFNKQYLEDILGDKFSSSVELMDNQFSLEIQKRLNTIHSQLTDSVLKPMMHRSDNFFAEQMLLMVSNEKLGVMNDEAIIDTLLKTDFKDLPQKPRWADGSGLSRYNLFTPQDMVMILKKMKDEFGMERIKVIFPTGGEGTISSYYKNEAGFIYGKTGTLSGVVAFSGFLYTKKDKLLIFSTIVNNHNESATDVRRAVEKFLIGIREKY